tara:strand:- start:14 stop:415 length:402 start_codon:yes stop_codon:yes gene_type:complete
MQRPKEKTVIQQYEAAIKCAKKHIKELEEVIDNKDKFIQKIIFEFIYEMIHTVKLSDYDATREVYKTIYYGDWKNHIDGEYLTQKENNQWFDDNHDRMLGVGDYASDCNYSYEYLMDWNLKQIEQQEGGKHAN